MSIGNDVVSSDFLKVLLALKDNIMRDLHCNDIGIVVSTSGNECVCKLLSNPDIKISCTKINNIITDKDDVVFIAYTDINSKHNVKQLSDQKDLRNQTIGNKHAYENAVIVLNYSKQSSGEGVTVDSSFSTTSTNALQNKVITNRFNQVESRLINVDGALSSTSTNPVQNKVLYNPVVFAESERQKSKNLFNSAMVPIKSDSLEYNVETNTFIYTITATIESSATGFVILKYGNLNAGTYTMSFDVTSTIGNTAPVIVAELDQYDNFKSSIATKNIIDGHVYLTFTLTEETNIGLAWYYKAGWIAGDAPPGVKTLTNLQLEEGSIATDYQSYNGAIVHEKEIADVEHIETIYDMTSSDSNINLGKTSGIVSGDEPINIDLSKYKKLIVTHCFFNSGFIKYTIDLDSSLLINNSNINISQYMGGATSFNQNNSEGSDSDQYFSNSSVNAEKTAFTHTLSGWFSSGTISARNNNYNSVVVKIEGVY